MRELRGNISRIHEVDGVPVTSKFFETNGKVMSTRKASLTSLSAKEFSKYYFRLDHILGSKLRIQGNKVFLVLEDKISSGSPIKIFNFPTKKNSNDNKYDYKLIVDSLEFLKNLSKKKDELILIPYIELSDSEKESLDDNIIMVL